MDSLEILASKTMTDQSMRSISTPFDDCFLNWNMAQTTEAPTTVTASTKTTDGSDFPKQFFHVVAGFVCLLFL